MSHPLKGIAKRPHLQKWLDLTKSIPPAQGLYCVWAGNVLLYIGQSKRLKYRLKDHTRKSEFVGMGANAITFTIVETERSRWERTDMEKWLIRKHKPPLNKPHWTQAKENV